MYRVAVLTLLSASSLLCFWNAFGDSSQKSDEAFSTGSGTVSSEDSESDSIRKNNLNDRKSKLRKRRDGGEKEAEGTEAPKRFNPNINIKSKYEFHGQPIEVDPD